MWPDGGTNALHWKWQQTIAQEEFESGLSMQFMTALFYFAILSHIRNSEIVLTSHP